MPRSAFIRLTPTHLPELLCALNADPVANVFLLHLARKTRLRDSRSGVTFYGYFGENAALNGVGVYGPTLLAWLPDLTPLPFLKAEAMHRLGQWEGLLGDVRSVDPLWNALRPYVDPPLEDYVERWMSSPRHDFRSAPSSRTVRIATKMDLSRILPLRFALYQEPEGRTMTSYDEERIRRRCEESIRDRLLFFAEEDGRVVFTATFSAFTPEVTQISSVYTHPEYRSRGIATAALSTLCSHAVETSERLSLFVAGWNLTAQRVYERLGFQSSGVVRSVRLASEFRK